MEYPLSTILPQEFIPDFLREEFNKIIITNHEVSSIDFIGDVVFNLTVTYRDNSGEPLHFSLLTDEQLRIEITELANLVFSFIQKINFSLTVGTIRIFLPSVFKPLDIDDNLIPNQRQLVQLSQSQALAINWNIDEGYQIKTLADEPVNLSVGSTMIGDTGIIFKVNELKFDISNDDFLISIKEGTIKLPKDIINFPEIIFSSCSINKKGFSGELKFEWDLLLDESNPNDVVYKMDNQPVRIFGEFTGGLDFFAVTFENNSIKSCSITGELLLPYFEGNRNNAVRISITINDSGEFSIVAKSTTGNDITLTKEELIKLHVQSLQIFKKEQIYGISISGGLEPLLFSKEGMKWPRMDVKNLKIDSTGKFSIEEAWLDLKDLATLDLFGFHFELRKIGIGTIDPNRFWIDLSGGLKLIEQIPIGLDVEGFRVIQPPQNSDIPEIQFKGIQISFGVPGAIQLDGLIRFFKDAQAVGFAGDMVLVIPPAGITAEAGLLVGMNTTNPPFPFFYVYFGLEAAAGIPLGQSGLALKGALGLFGINVAPNRLPEQNWYFDWYKKPPAPGAHQTTKWKDERDALAVGAGLTITTVDGIVKGTKGIIVLVLPGPILVINGKALILDGLNPNPNAEPPFSATAIFDGREKIVQFNIEAQAEIVEDMVDAYAGVEAFFDFKDITNWHLYLGQDQPEDRRIRANILNVIEADAYLMLDMIDEDSLRARMGVEVSVKPKIDDICVDIPFWGEECIRFDAHINLGGYGEVSAQPEQFSGNAFIDVGVEIKALDFEIEIGANADISVEGPSPFSLQADLDLYANLPEPLPDYEDSYHYELTIPKVELQVNNPLTSVSLFSRFTSESKSLKIEEDTIIGKQNESEYLENTTIADCDINPIISFEHEMNQDYTFIMHPGGEKTYDTGAIRFSPTLEKLVIKEKNKNDNSGWKIIYSTEQSQNKPIIGTWLAENDPASPSTPASRRLQLMTTNPLTNTTHYTGMIGNLMMQIESDKTHLSKQILEDYPDLMICTQKEIVPLCVNFKYSGKPIKKNNIKWANLVFISSNEIVIDKSCLQSFNDLKVSFPESVIYVEITFCNKIDKLEITTYSAPKKKELIRIIEESSKSGKKQDISCSIPVKNNTERTSNKIKITANNNSFDCLLIDSKNKEGIQIESICYITERAKIDFEINRKICESNKKNIFPPFLQSSSGDPFRDNNIFKPGCYYEVEVQTILNGEVIPSKIEESPVKDFIIGLYQESLSDIKTLWKGFAYFQTDSPPQNLNPYIKWSSPLLNEYNVFIKNPIQVRFKRGYIKTLFGNNNLNEHKLKVYIKDTDGKFSLIPETNLKWLTAGSSTLFPNEETWQNHLSENQISNLFKRDDILNISLDRLDFYKTSKRYELFLVGMKRSDISNDEQTKNKNVLKLGGDYFNILSSIPFATSKFESFAQLINSGNSENNKVSPVILPCNQVPFTTNFNELVNAYVNSEIEYNKTLIDYEYGMANALKDQIRLVSKEAIEHRKIELRNKRDLIDEEFRRIALAVKSEILFTDTESKLTIYALKNTLNNIEIVWIKLPESQKIKFYNYSPGKFDCNLYIGSQLINKRIFNSDTTQIIFKIDEPVSINDLNKLKVSVSYIKDSGDDANNIIYGNIQNSHHRYDRPSLKGIGIETIEIEFEED